MYQNCCIPGTEAKCPKHRHSNKQERLGVDRNEKKTQTYATRVGGRSRGRRHGQTVHPTTATLGNQRDPTTYTAINKIDLYFVDFNALFYFKALFNI